MQQSCKTPFGSENTYCEHSRGPPARSFCDNRIVAKRKRLPAVNARSPTESQACGCQRLSPAHPPSRVYADSGFLAGLLARDSSSEVAFPRRPDAVAANFVVLPHSGGAAPESHRVPSSRHPSREQWTTTSTYVLLTNKYNELARFRERRIIGPKLSPVKRLVFPAATGGDYRRVLRRRLYVKL